MFNANEVIFPFFKLPRPEAIILLVQDNGENVHISSIWRETERGLGSLQSTRDEETRYG